MKTKEKIELYGVARAFVQKVWPPLLWMVRSPFPHRHLGAGEDVAHFSDEFLLRC